MGLRYFQIQIMNDRAARISNNIEPNELEYMNMDGKSKLGLAPGQRINVKSPIRDFYSPSSDLGSRQIVSTRVKNVLETYRDDNLVFIHCPITKGDKILIDYWITDVRLYNDEIVDIKQSQFKLIEGWIEKKVNGVATEFGQKISVIYFKDLDEFNSFENDLNYLSSIKPVKLSIKKDCDLPYFFLRSFGIFDLIVSEELKGEIQKQKMDKGIEFKPLDISDEDWYGPNGLRKQFYK